MARGFTGRRRTALLGAVVATLVLGMLAGPVAAQEEGLVLSTPYPGVAVEPGDSATLDLTVTAPTRQQVRLSVSGAPDGWSTSFTGGGFLVDTVTAGPESPALQLDVDVPADAAEGEYELTVTAQGPAGSASIPVRITVTGGAGGEVTLEPEFPVARASSGTTFDFDVTVRNDTPAQVTAEVSAEGPAGWRIEARPSGENQAAAVTIDSGSTERFVVEVTPAFDAEAGQYPLVVRASGEGVSAEAEMMVELVGSYDMTITTADGRLNTEVTVGSSAEQVFIVENRGTAPLLGVEMSARPPSGWEVQLSPETIPQIMPGEIAQVVATITPSEDAIAGDYVITLNADTEPVRESVEIRTTVSPSVVWGFVGIGLIVLAIAGLGYVFRRFGRR